MLVWCSRDGARGPASGVNTRKLSQKQTERRPALHRHTAVTGRGVLYLVEPMYLLFVESRADKKCCWCVTGAVPSLVSSQKLAGRTKKSVEQATEDRIE